MVWQYNNNNNNNNNIAHLSQWGGGGYFTRTNDFYLPFAALRGGGGQHPVGHMVDSPDLLARSEVPYPHSHIEAARDQCAL